MNATWEMIPGDALGSGQEAMPPIAFYRTASSLSKMKFIYFIGTM